MNCKILKQNCLIKVLLCLGRTTSLLIGNQYCLIPSTLLPNLEPSYFLMKKGKEKISITIQLL